MRAREAREAQRKRLWGSGTHVTVNPNPSPQTTCHGPPYFLSMPSLIIFAAICSGETARLCEREERRFAQGRARGARRQRRRPARAPPTPRGSAPRPRPARARTSIFSGCLSIPLMIASIDSVRISSVMSHCC